MYRTDPSRRGRTALVASVVAILVVAGALWLSVGVEGLLVAGVVAVVWSVSRPEYAVAVGGVVYVVLLSGVGEYTALAGASLVAVFAADALTRWPARTAGITLLALLTAVAVSSEASRVAPTWHGALAMVGGFALVAYTVHRYELVGLGLVGGTRP